MVRYKGNYDVESYCIECREWTPIPTHIPIDFRIGATNEGSNEQYYDITGKQVDVLVLLPIKQLAWKTRDEKGTFIKMINEIVSNVNCQYCGKKCRGRSHNKKDKRNRKDKRRTRQENTMPNSAGIKLIDDTIKRLETQVEFEKDLSLRLDDPEAKNVGTSASYMRGEIEKTLEDVLSLRKKYVLNEKGVQKEHDPEVNRYIKSIKMSPKITSYITECLKSTNPELYSRVMSRLGKYEAREKTSHII